MAEPQISSEYTSDSQTVECPACGIRSTRAERIASGDTSRCPNCGTSVLAQSGLSPEAQAGAPSSETASSEIASSDAHVQETASIAPLEATLPHDTIPTADRTPSTNELLLERLKNAPAIPDQLPQRSLIVILLAILLAGVGIALATKQPDKYLPESATEQSQENPHQLSQQDTTELHAKRLALVPVIDSLKGVLATNPKDTAALLDLGNVLFDVQYWRECMQTYEQYLKVNPKNADVRVEYAATIERVDHNPDAALNEIEKALEDDPENVRGLFTGGMIASMKIGTTGGEGGHSEAIAQAKSYFERAKLAAEKRDTSILPAINDMLAKFESVSQQKP